MKIIAYYIATSVALACIYHFNSLALMGIVDGRAIDCTILNGVVLGIMCIVALRQHQRPLWFFAACELTMILGGLAVFYGAVMDNPEPTPVILLGTWLAYGSVLPWALRLGGRS